MLVQPFRVHYPLRYSLTRHVFTDLAICSCSMISIYAVLTLYCMAYTLSLIWNTGKDHHIADTLSRALVFGSEEEDEEEASAVPADSFVYQILQDPLFQNTFDNLKMDTFNMDTDYTSIIHAIRSGCTITDLPVEHPARAYSNVFRQLSLLDKEEETLILLGERYVVPRALRKSYLSLLHMRMSHQGVAKTRATAQCLYFWPTINNDIKVMVETCDVCQMRQPILPKLPRTINEELGKQSPLRLGDRVHIQHKDTKRWSTRGHVVSINPRSYGYGVENEEGVQIRRSRQFLRKDSSHVKLEEAALPPKKIVIKMECAAPCLPPYSTHTGKNTND